MVNKQKIHLISNNNKKNKRYILSNVIGGNKDDTPEVSQTDTTEEVESAPPEEKVETAPPEEKVETAPASGSSNLTNDIISKIKEIIETLNSYVIDLNKDGNNIQIENLIDDTDIDTLTLTINKLDDKIKKKLLDHIILFINKDKDIITEFKEVDDKIINKINKFTINFELFKLQINTIKVYIKLNQPIEKQPETLKSLDKLMLLLEGKIKLVNDALQDAINESNNRPIVESESTSKSVYNSIPKDTTGKIAPRDNSEIVLNSVKDKLLDLEKRLQKGGSNIWRDNIKELFEKLNKINIFFQSDIMLKLLTIVSYKEEFNKIDDSIKNDILEILFIDTIEFDVLISKIKTKISGDIEINNYESYKNRDTIIYNLYKKSPSKILTYKIISYLVNINYHPHILSSDTTYKLIDIINKYIDKILKLIDNFNTIFDLQDNINTSYKNIIKKYQKVFTFVKERLDKIDENSDEYFKKNARYEMTRINESSFYKLQYYNYSNNVATNTDKTEYGSTPEFYYMGPYDGYFNHNLSNAEAANKMYPIINNLLLGKKDICIIGYGQSGSGKTSSLIFLKKKSGAEEDGILIELCNKFINNNTDEFNCDKIELNMKNIYMWHGLNIDNQKKVKNDYYRIDDIKLDDKELTFINNNNKWIYIKDKDKESKRGLGKFINDAFNQREVEPTTNNENSSRSHVLVCLTLIKDGQNDTRKIVICDLAGVENKFDCENNNELNSFSEQYSKSNKYGSTKFMNVDTYFCDQKKDTNRPSAIKDAEEIKIYNDVINDINHKINIYNSYKNKLEEINNYKKKQYNIIELLDKVTPDPIPLNTTTSDNCIANIDSICTDNKLKYYDKHNGDINNINDNIKELQTNIIDHFKYLILYKQINNLNISNEQLIKSVTLNFFKNFKELKDRELLSKFITYHNNNYNDTVIVPADINNSPNDSSRVKLYNDIKDKVLIDSDKDNFPNKITKLLEEIRLWYCDYIIIKNISYNCKLRIKEGYMINKSLSDLRTAIQNLIIESLKIDVDDKTKILPIFYEKELIPYCRNININHPSINYFYERYVNINKTSNLNSIIFDILINQFKINISDLNFVIFTVINLNPYKNNPPNPPYININKLIYDYYLKQYNNEVEKKGQLINSTNEIYTKLKNYPFYIKYKDLQIDENSQDINIRIENLIDDIKTNNSATLIGSLESTDILQNTTFLKYQGCSLDNYIFKDIYTNSYFYNIDNGENIAVLKYATDLEWEKINTDFINNKYNISFDKSKEKYIKYKNKYLALKNEMVAKGLI